LHAWQMLANLLRAIDVAVRGRCSTGHAVIRPVRLDYVVGTGIALVEVVLQRESTRITLGVLLAQDTRGGT